MVAATVILSWLAWQAFAGQRALGESLVRSRVREIGQRYAGRVGDEMYVATTSIFRPLRAGRFATLSAHALSYDQVQGAVVEVERCRCAPVLRPTYAFLSDGTAAGTTVVGDSTAVDVDWIAASVAARTKLLYRGWDVALLPSVEPKGGHALFIAPVRRADSDTNSAVLGIAIAPRSLADWILRPLLEQTHVDSTRRDVRLGALVRDAGGRQIFASGDTVARVTSARVELGDIWAGWSVEMSLAGSARDVEALVGLPRSPLPMLVVLLAVAVTLVAVSCVLLWRMIDITRLRSDFTSSVSHELRTPLTQIQLYADTMRMGRNDSADSQQRAVDIISRETRRLIHLVENVLRFSRTERQVETLALRSHQLGTIVESAVESFSLIADARGVKVRCDIDQRVAAVVDPDGIRQIVLNLLDNAVRYGPTGQTVSVSVTRRGDRARIAVLDEGPGIPLAERERVWDAFTRGERGGADPSSTGCGIGLSIVSDLARQMNGRYGIDDSPRGALVFVEVSAVDE